MITFNAKVSREAQGLEKAPVVLKGASVLNVFTEEWDVADIAIYIDLEPRGRLADDGHLITGTEGPDDVLL